MRYWDLKTLIVQFSVHLDSRTAWTEGCNAAIIAKTSLKQIISNEYHHIVLPQYEMPYESLISKRIVHSDRNMSTYSLQHVCIIYIRNSMDRRKQNNLKAILRTMNVNEVSSFLHCLVSLQHEQSVVDHGCSKSQTFRPG